MHSPLRRISFLVLVLALVARGHAQGPDATPLSLMGVASASVGQTEESDPVAPDREAPAPLAPRTFVTGFNQAWLSDHYASHWTTNHDAAEAARLLAVTRANGGSVLRMWLFENLVPEGVTWQDDPLPPDALPGTVAVSRPTGLDAKKLANIETFLEAAEKENVKVYFTFFDGNVATFDKRAGPASPEIRRFQAILNDTDGVGTSFLENVVRPLTAVLARHQNAVFGVDLCNEVNIFTNGLLNGGYFAAGASGDRWIALRAFVTKWRAFIKNQVDIPVSVSVQQGAMLSLITGGLPPELVDFYDFHWYDDSGTFKVTTRLGAVDFTGRIRAFAERVKKPVYCGEFGQLTQVYDDALQARCVEGFLRSAKAAGLAGAFPWRLSQLGVGHTPAMWPQFEVDGKGVFRPAMEVFRRVSAELTAEARP